MKSSSLFKTTVLAAAIGFSTASSALITFDVNGDTKPGGTINVDVFDWFPDNALFDSLIPIPAAPATITGTLRYQAALGSFGPGGMLDTGAELTIQAVIPVTATVGGTVLGTELAIDAILPGGTFDIYYDDTGTGGLGTTGGVISDDITGLGYGDGRHILHGSVLDFPAGTFGSINISLSSGGLLDQFGTDNQDGVLTSMISGSINYEVEVDPDAGSSNADVVAMGFDESFFPIINGNSIDRVGEHDILHSQDNNGPFNKANPSDVVVGVAPDYGSGAGVNAGEINDNSCTSGGGASTPCDLHAQSDGSSSFLANTVPEPASVGLLGIGLLGMTALRRRNRKA